MALFSFFSGWFQNNSQQSYDITYNYQDLIYNLTSYGNQINDLTSSQKALEQQIYTMENRETLATKVARILSYYFAAKIGIKVLPVIVDYIHEKGLEAQAIGSA